MTVELLREIREKKIKQREELMKLIFRYHNRIGKVSDRVNKLDREIEKLDGYALCARNPEEDENRK